ncbi:portal protein [Pantoea phage vB_PagS_Vid5]|uniref:Portal protein n=1 Tax=Pantoea phage vB_PagS_Vid5 TaxID=2099652 RepID=A0A2P1CKP9_9CAUD|nr:portal protein [Pantoea phage vB_PagS_Vid5]AVJ51758.1 portal protein [Pantoea phage vB_PagS_Vid5]
MTAVNQHPSYARWLDEWDKLDDCYDGETKVKSLGTKYLPATSGMYIDGMTPPEGLGWKQYDAYRLRAVFPDEFSEAMKNYLGLLHQKPPVITVPEGMKGMLSRATSQGENMEALLRRINEYQLLHGRLGVLLDFPVSADATALPYVAVYNAKSIPNWDDGEIDMGKASLNLVVLDESGPRRDGRFSWKQVEQYRVLVLGDLESNEAESDTMGRPGSPVYQFGVFASENFDDPNGYSTPTYRGIPANFIPFEFINTTDITSEPDTPPLLGLANTCLTIYRGEADYRQTLFLQGQETLVVKGGVTTEGEESVRRVGAGAVINVSDAGDAKYIGVSAKGLSEMRSALENDRKEATLKSGQMIGTAQSSQESGEAMKTRIAARTASLVRIAYTGAIGLESLLKKCAVWMGLNPDEVSVKPNLEFAKNVFSGQNLVQIMTGRNLGAPLSLESIHAWAVDQGFTTLTFEEEMKMYAENMKKWPVPGTQTADLNTAQQGALNNDAPPQQPQGSTQ